MENNENQEFIFSKINYKLVIIGMVVVILGFILMSGGGTDDPNEFDGEALFSFTRITLAPFMVIAGYVVILYGILKKPKAE